MNIKIYALLLFFGTLLPQLSAAQESNVKGDAGFLFAYYPKEGEQALFNEGYKQHFTLYEQLDGGQQLNDAEGLLRRSSSTTHKVSLSRLWLYRLYFDEQAPMQDPPAVGQVLAQQETLI